MSFEVPEKLARHAVTEDMWREFLTNPVMGCEILLNSRFDAFQQNRLTYYHFVPRVNDSSGYSSAKTTVVIAATLYRCLVLPERRIGIYYPTAGTGRNTYWDGAIKMIDRNPILRDAVAGTSQDSAMHRINFKDGGAIILPAPGFAKDAASQASMRFHDMHIEEWTHIDASSDGINAQLIGRPTKDNWNQHHPVWTNHLVFSAPAKTRGHKAYVRFEKHWKFAQSGNHKYATLHYSYKDYSNLPVQPGSKETFKHKYRNEDMIQGKKTEAKDPSEWLAEGLGVWASSAVGWFTENAMDNARAIGRKRNVTPIVSRDQFTPQPAL